MWPWLTEWVLSRWLRFRVRALWSRIWWKSRFLLLYTKYNFNTLSNSSHSINIVDYLKVYYTSRSLSPCFPHPPPLPPPPPPALPPPPPPRPPPPLPSPPPILWSPKVGQTYRMGGVPPPPPRRPNPPPSRAHDPSSTRAGATRVRFNARARLSPASVPCCCSLNAFYECPADKSALPYVAVQCKQRPVCPPDTFARVPRPSLAHAARTRTATASWYAQATSSCSAASASSRLFARWSLERSRQNAVRYHHSYRIDGVLNVWALSNKIPCFYLVY